MIQRFQQYDRSRESGIVSIMTVLFFMIFISLIIVGFMAIVADDSRQTTDNDLSQSALHAARSGVEEGKRIVLYCAQNPTAPGCSSGALNDGKCDTFTTGIGQPAAAALGITADSTTGNVRVGSMNGYEQYFTCLIIRQNTEMVSGAVSADNDYVVKLQTQGPYETLRVSWTGTGSYSIPTTKTTNWTKEADWKEAGVARPPVLRVQLVPYKTDDFVNPTGLDDIERNSRSVFVVPCANTAACRSALITDINALDSRQSAPGVTRPGAAPTAYATCSGGTTYTCTMDLTGLSVQTGPSQGRTYYARVSLIYGETAQVTFAALAQGSGSPVLFNGVQPKIDVTGRTNDVYRRLQAEVSYDTGVQLPPGFVVDSRAPICKDMISTTSPDSSQLNCTY